MSSAMPERISFYFLDGLALPRIECSPTGALCLTLTQGPEQLAVHLSYPSLEALWFELTSALAQVRRS